MLSPISEPQGFELGVGEAGRTGPSLSHTPHNILTLNYHLADGTKYRITNTRAALASGEIFFLFRVDQGSRTRVKT
jgi:hypothetical protein